MASFLQQDVTGSATRLLSEASDAANATSGSWRDAVGQGLQAVQAAGSAISGASNAAVQGAVQGLQTSQSSAKNLVPAAFRDAMPSWTGVPSEDSTSGSKPVGSGVKLFTACLVADHGGIRQQCSIEMKTRPAAAGSRRNLLLTREKTAAKLEIATVIDWQNVPGDTPLIVCCWRGDALAAKLLIDAGADVSLCNHMGVSPLLMSCHQGHRECAMLCLASGADVDDADDEEFAPVYAAACGGHSEIVHDCIVVGADVSGATGARALIACCYQGHVECAALLVHAGADPDAHYDGRTAIEWATDRGHSKTARVVEVCTEMRLVSGAGSQAAFGRPTNRGDTLASGASAHDRKLKRFASSQFQAQLLGASWIMPTEEAEEGQALPSSRGGSPVEKVRSKGASPVLRAESPTPTASLPPRSSPSPPGW